ncbi:FadR family transcriptional regulator [Anaerotignum lactatifermentans]|uniref:FadR family transcriptional regulator n=1 Tax=Anaerotignum lactatifermentans TaxID=160404 RepID=A0ABS2GA97_9FIRM|nr:GntR family transcriptional regulator [Anaerotignum lactatifermentans]MBM6829202.1 FadR family transcriptional regulator [Anaerotignum lactatifermentans]MBM6877558.1 FadR family transcriptional regulator [Anaerotignum lactatifermentans]MBM6950780.1 FadR family transcriptional regulator [Anaerotignum lactatifermentans]
MATKSKEIGLKPIQKESVVQQVIDRLTEAMLTGALKPGDKIPTELEMSESFGVGRNSIREAIKILVYLGVLEIRRADGTFVRSGFTDSMIDPMIYGIILNEDDSYTELKEFREFMEQSIIRSALKKRTQEDVEKLYEKYCVLEEAIQAEPMDILKVFEADNDFHDTISEMIHNSLMFKINSVVRTLTYSLRLRTVTHVLENQLKEDLLRVHKDIYEVIQNQAYDRIDEVIHNSYLYDKLTYEDH